MTSLSEPQAPMGVEGAPPAPSSETGDGVPEAAVSAEAQRCPPVDQGAAKESARRPPSWLYDAKSRTEAPPVQVAGPGAGQPQASTSSEASKAVSVGNKYLEGIGDVLASADAWLPSGKAKAS